MFGLVLDIGIVLDDAIVVVEKVGGHIAEGLSPREATKVARSEVWCESSDNSHHAGLVAVSAGLTLRERTHRRVLTAGSRPPRHLHGDIGRQIRDTLPSDRAVAAQAPTEPSPTPPPGGDE